MVRDPGYYDGINSYWSNGMWQNLLMSGAQGLLSGGIRSLFNKRERPVRGFEAGALQKQYFKGLYGDKLNPWEWSGSGGFGEGGASAPLMAGVQARKTLDQQQTTQVALEMAKMDTQKQIAQISADATVKAAGTQPDSKTRHDELLNEMQEAINIYKNEIAQGKRNESGWGHIKGLKTLFDNLQSWYDWLAKGNILSDDQRQKISDVIYGVKQKFAPEKPMALDKSGVPNIRSLRPPPAGLSLSLGKAPDFDQRKYDPQHNSTGKDLTPWRYHQKHPEIYTNELLKHYSHGYNKKKWKPKRRK